MSYVNSALKPRSLHLIFGICCVLIFDATAAPFRNLDFEEYDASRNFLPGWHLSWPHNYAGRRINETNITIGRPADFPDGPLAAMMDVSLFPNQGLNGKYALHFEFTDWILSQQGDLPEDVQFLRWASLGPFPLELKIDGVGVPVEYIYAPAWQSFRALAQADISAYAGKNVEMKLTVLPPPPEFTAPGQAYYTIVDSFGFQPIPEPSTLALIGIGLLLAWRMWRVR
jgi:hypothetical protein